MAISKLNKLLESIFIMKRDIHWYMGSRNKNPQTTILLTIITYKWLNKYFLNVNYHIL